MWLVTLLTFRENIKAGMEQIREGHAHKKVNIRFDIENLRKFRGISPDLE